MNDVKLDWNDITLVPADQSIIKSRKSVNVHAYDANFGKQMTLPIISAPMDSVISGKDNAYNVGIVRLLLDAGIRPCIPRSQEISSLFLTDVFISYSLEEIKKLASAGKLKKERICIDMANGHMQELVDTISEIKKEYPEVVIMAGNIANPNTFRTLSEAGCDYIRVGIGGGSACTTACFTGVYYPLATLVHECYQIKQQMEREFQSTAKLVCDGGIATPADFIKALALGADYVMMGSLLAKTLESDSVPYLAKFIPVKNKRLANWLFSKKIILWKKYRGMSTQEVQKDWHLKQHGEIKHKELRLSEGIVKWNRVEYRLFDFLGKLEGYLRSAMSYSNARTLEEFRENSSFVQVTPAAFARFKK